MTADEYHLAVQRFDQDRIDIEIVKSSLQPEDLDQIILHTIEQTIKEGIEIIKDELKNAPLEVQMSKGIIFANVVKRLETLTDTQHALRGIIK